ncbi:IclR family transcriptional regulator [Hyphomicrobium sp. CS1GBMeth3]|uniref:IclR family transcriptional regulator n=1 Tax=Hyphomicrobium sp. CS1GBMeth3 TaxID=1892845 RepID=UPI000ACB18D9|nr:IclR family transcriptional regulator [Hyphomicrobium sp. CS1GBMeth3]
MTTKKSTAGSGRAAKSTQKAKKSTPSALKDSPLRGMVRSFAVLEYLAASPSRVVEVTRALNLPWATVHRTIIQLEKAQFLRRDPETNRYEIGPRLWYVGSAYLSNHRVLKVALPYLSRLESVEGIAMQVVERIGWQSVAIYSHQRVDEDITKAHYGYHFPLHCSSKGHVLLANEDPAFIETYLKRDLERLTPETITDPKVLRNILEEVREDDFSLTVADVQMFTGSMSAPIRDSSGRVIACLSFVFRKTLLKNEKRRDELQERLMQAAHSISLDLGWRPGQR